MTLDKLSKVTSIAAENFASSTGKFTDMLFSLENKAEAKVCEFVELKIECTSPA